MSPIVKEFSQKQSAMTGRQMSEISDLKIRDTFDSMCLIEPHREKTGFLPMRKQRRRSASR